MHGLVLSLASVWMALLLAAAVILAVRARSALSRILAVDTVVLVLIALLSARAGAESSPYLLDAAVALAALSFVGTLALARLYGEERPFR